MVALLSGSTWKRFSQRVGRFTLAIGCAAALPLIACQTAAVGVGLLPPPPAGELKFSSYSPVAPYAQQAPGLLSRRAFSASSGSGYRIEVLDLLVGPRQKAGAVTLGGPAVLEIRSGTAVMGDGDRKQQLQTGTTHSLPEGRTFSIENGSDVALSLRAHVFVAE